MSDGLHLLGFMEHLRSCDLDKNSWPLMITMKATSAANHASVLSLLEQGYSVRDIGRRTGLGKSTVGRIKKEVDTEEGKQSWWSFFQTFYL